MAKKIINAKKAAGWAIAIPLEKRRGINTHEVAWDSVRDTKKVTISAYVRTHCHAHCTCGATRARFGRELPCTNDRWPYGVEKQHCTDPTGECWKKFTALGFDCVKVELSVARPTLIEC